MASVVRVCAARPAGQHRSVTQSSFHLQLAHARADSAERCCLSHELCPMCTSSFHVHVHRMSVCAAHMRVVCVEVLARAQVWLVPSTTCRIPQMQIPSTDGPTLATFSRPSSAALAPAILPLHVQSRAGSTSSFPRISTTRTTAARHVSLRPSDRVAVSATTTGATARRALAATPHSHHQHPRPLRRWRRRLLRHTRRQLHRLQRPRPHRHRRPQPHPRRVQSRPP